MLVEVSYGVYTRPHNHRVRDNLLRFSNATTHCTRVGDNAKMVAWPSERLNDCCYPASFALDRFYTGQTICYGALLHFGADAITADLPAWVAFHNGRQTVEAGIKEGHGAVADALSQSPQGAGVLAARAICCLRC